MPYVLTMEVKDDILWVAATGERTLETVMAMAKDILAASSEHKIPRVLIDVCKLKGSLKTMDSYEVPDRYFSTIRDSGGISRSAIVDRKELDTSFFENVARNRGYNLRIFSDPEEAFRWLKE